MSKGICFILSRENTTTYKSHTVFNANLSRIEE